MKKAFDDETAGFLGYQKYYPTKAEWFFYFAVGVLVEILFIVGGALLIEYFN